MGFYATGAGVVDINHFIKAAQVIQDGKSAAKAKARRSLGEGPEERPGGAAIVPLLFYRAMLLAGDCAPIDALAAALARRGMLAVPIFVPTLKDADVADFIKATMTALPPAVMITTTAFAISPAADGASLFDDIGVPVMQAVIATTRRQSWATSARGLGVSDIAMHVVLPELDGRILAGALSFKDYEHAAGDCLDDDLVRPPQSPQPLQLPQDSQSPRQPPRSPRQPPPSPPAGPLQFNALHNRPEADRIEMVAARVAALIKLQTTPPGDRRLLIIMPDYPGADGRTGYAVGLDVPASVLAMLADLAAVGYDVRNIPAGARDLLALLAEAKPGLAAQHWCQAFQRLPEAARDDLVKAWGAPSASGVHQFRHASFGNITVALAPDRGQAAKRRADYHDPALPPRHELLAFGLWAREALRCHAIVHCGAHGTLEWLPGKAVALSKACFPEIIGGPLPIIYPFIVNNPGEAAQAKRRIAALTIGHMPPPMIDAGLSPQQRDLERLVDEYVQADGLDVRRQRRLARLILDKAAATRLDSAAGVGPGDGDDEALKRIDTWLCDLKDFAIKDGQHIYGRAEPGCCDRKRLTSAGLERDNFLAALNGRFVSPGPAGSPSRGRRDIYPTGRNLFTIDPRMMPTSVAFEIGTAAAEEVLRLYLLDHGDWPRALVIDLWASASLRSGGEQIAQGLALLGCRPQWHGESGRVSGIEVLPPAAIGRPRIDVTWRISGLFRDMFPAQIALMNAAVEAIARRGEEDGDNPLAVEFKSSGIVPRRVFGSSPGSYGSGAEALLQSGGWQDRQELGEAYLAGGSYSFSGAEGAGELLPGAFGERLAGADLLVHVSDDNGHDLLEGSADVAHVGGFAAAIEAIGSTADVICLDTTDPQRPRARRLADAIARVVHARAINPRYIRGQMRHGPRGASDFAETVDRLIGFAETTNAVPDGLIDALYDAYIGDHDVRAFLLHENPEAAQAIAARMDNALQRGLWHPRRNSTPNELRKLIAEASMAPCLSDAGRSAENRSDADLTDAGLYDADLSDADLAAGEGSEK